MDTLGNIFKALPSFNQTPNTTFNADLPLPAEVTSGLSYQVTDKWMVAFDYNYTLWSVYEALDVKFANGTESLNPRNYKNSSTYRVGTQYVVNDKFALKIAKK